MLEAAANPKNKRRNTKSGIATMTAASKDSIKVYDREYREQVLLTEKLRRFIRRLEKAYLYAGGRTRGRGAGREAESGRGGEAGAGRGEAERKQGTSSPRRGLGGILNSAHTQRGCRAAQVLGQGERRQPRHSGSASRPRVPAPSAAVCELHVCCGSPRNPVTLSFSRCSALLAGAAAHP